MINDKSTYRTVKEHLLSIADSEIRNKCLANLDDRQSGYKCYTIGMAIMIGVWQKPEEKAHWESVYYYVNTGKIMTDGK